MVPWRLGGLGLMPSLPLIGEAVAGYRLHAVLGRGGMSVVFQAESVRLGNTVALKVLSPELSSDDRFRTRFLQESRTAAALNHPHVIPVYDSGSFEDLLYLSMRYVAGTDLRRRLRAADGLSREGALLVLEQTGRALDAAHRAGLVHRDVKPANILIEDVGAEEPDHVYLADFGIAKHAASISGLTSTGQFVGTLDYIAPEQIRAGAVSERTDIYSLGCVMYECLTGQVPFRKDVDAAVIWAHVEEEPEAPSAVRPDLPSAIDAVLSQAMAKRPEDRYPSCRQLMIAARAALTPAARQAAGPDRRSTPSDRPKRDLSEMADIATSGGAAPLAATVSDPPGDASSGPPGDRSASSTDAGGGGQGRWRLGWLPWLLGVGGTVVVAAVLVLALSGGRSAHGHTATSSSKTPGRGQAGMGSSGGSGMSMNARLRHSALWNALVGVNTNAYSRNLLPLSTCTPKSASKVTCTDVTNNSASAVAFETYPSVSALYRAYTAQYRAINRTAFRANYNDCNETHDHGEVSWNHAGKHSRSYSLADVAIGTVSPDEAFGRLFCGYDSSYQFHIVWTQNQGRMLGTVMGGPHNATWDWWHKVHHEISFSGSAMSMSGSMR